jgi:two-component system sensor histidine kinase/response regulator
MATALDDFWPADAGGPRAPERRPSSLYVLLVAGFAAFVLTGAFAFVRHQRNQQRRLATEYLAAIVHLKAHELTTWLDERRGDAAVAGRNWVFSRALESRHLGRETYSAAALSQAEVFRGSYHYRDVFILEPDGRLVLGTNPDPANITVETRAALTAALAHGGVEVTRSWVDGEGAPPAIDVVAPVRGSDNESSRIIGAVVLRIDPRAHLWPLLAEWPAARRSGRLALVHSEGDQVVFFDAGHADAKDYDGAQRALDTPGLAHARAALGASELGEVVDEAGRPVIAAARPIANWPWVMLAMLPRAEVDAQAGYSGWLAAGWIVAFVGGAVVLARRHSRRLSERVLRASEERLRLSQALAHAGSWDWDLRHESPVLSDELCRILGLAPGCPVSARTLLTLVPRTERRSVTKALRAARAGQRPLSLEHEIHRSDGQVRLVQHEARLHGDPADGPGRLIGVVLDITERRRAEQALRESETTFKNLFEDMQDAFLTVEFGGERRILRANPAAVRMLGYERAAELEGLSMARDVSAHPEESQALRAQLLSSGVARDQRATFRRADGSEVVVEGNVRLIRDAEGRPLALEGVVRDMSAHYQRQAELIAAREAALEASKVKSRFLANMSHEIRTPLNAIVGLSHLMLRGQLPAQLRDYVAKIQTSARMLLDVINSVLDFSKIEAGKLSLESTPFYLDEVLDGVANVVAVEAQAKGLELVFSLSPAVPVSLLGDPLRLGQVLTNLINNAVKFTSAGEVVISVEAVARTAQRARLRFSVRDTGIGLSQEQLARLFVPFTQADDSDTRRFGGTGLGLAISRQLVELMGGNIEAVSQPGGGSTFSFTIELALAPARVPVAAGPDELRGRRVLVVDDHSVARMVLERYLQDMLFTVETVGSGGEALRRLRDAEAAGRRFDLVLLDWKMPTPDGLETARQIRHHFGQPPTIILVTAHAHDEVAPQVERMGIEGILIKPVTRSVLLDTIARVLGRGAVRSVTADRRPPGQLQAAHVLVVEDNEINQQVARELLESAGVVVSIAANGREAVRAVSAAAAGPRLDAVLMDIQMPEMDGYEATREIRKDPQNASLPIIAMTAHALDSERERCAQAGMNGHVAKPVDPAALFGVLAEWLERRPRPDDGGAASLGIPGIDFNGALRRLRGNRELLMRLLGELVQQWRDGARRIRDQLARAERDEALRTAHTLKGAAANLGVDELAAAAGAVERTLAASDEAGAAAAVAHLDITLGTVCAALEQHVPVPA